MQNCSFDFWAEHYIAHAHNIAAFWLRHNPAMQGTPVYLQICEIRDRAAEYYEGTNAKPSDDAKPAGGNG